MRVFRYYWFNLKDRVLFKDTLAFIEKWLAEKNIKYSGMGFILDHGNNDKISQKYPSIKKYIKPTPESGMGKISSISDNWDEDKKIHVEQEDENIVREIATKIPRPYNYAFMRFFLDNIQWFDEINTEPAIKLPYNRKPDHPTEFPSAFSVLHVHKSNSIHIIKEFDYGKKLNPIEVCIEVTKNDDELLSDENIVNALSDLLGKPYVKSTEIVFDENLQEKFRSAEEHINEKIKILKEKITIPEYERKYIPDPDEYIARFEHEINLKGIAPKKALLPLCKEYGYKYSKHPGNSGYECIKINGNNHKFTIEFVQLPVKRIFECYLWMQGCNFNFSLALGEFCPDNQEELESRFKDAFKLAISVEPQLSEQLLYYYGKTPNWFFI